jgi:hypothetical protein
MPGHRIDEPDYLRITIDVTLRYFFIAVILGFIIGIIGFSVGSHWAYNNMVQLGPLP